MTTAVVNARGPSPCRLLLGRTYQQLDRQAPAYDNEAAAAQSLQTQRDVQTLLQAQHSALQAGTQQWTLEYQATTQLQTVVQSLSKGMALGETPLTEVLNTPAPGHPTEH